MRVCLQCAAEYVDDPLVCRSCGADTISAEEALRQRVLRSRLSSEKLVEIYTLESPVDEAIVVELLEADGVEFLIHGGSIHGVMPGVDHGGGIGYGVVMVASEQAEQARQVVRRYQDSVVEDAFADADTEA